MGEIVLFYWTGKIVWWILCAAFLLLVLGVAIVIPLYVLARQKRALRHWRIFGTFCRTELTERDLEWFAHSCGPLPCDADVLIGWLEAVLKRRDFCIKEREIGNHEGN
jgi:hypothetical protein